MAKQEEMIMRECKPLGRYRVRLLENGRGKFLDIREFVSGEKFSGFTRRGIRLTYPIEVQALWKMLSETLATPIGSASSEQ